MSSESGHVLDSADFVRQLEPFRGELLAHCYRMLGSVDDAEDVVQETHLRAWRAYGSFEGRSSLRAWLYKIATNGCLSALNRRRRRALPSGLGGPSEDPSAPPVEAGPEVSWVEPFPLALVTSESQDPAVLVASRESLKLALVASLQYLPPRQRAVLLLCEVLAFTVAEVARMLETSIKAVKSALQRARARLEEVAPAADAIQEPTDPDAQALLLRYIAAFEKSDAKAIERLLCDDATLELIPSRTWFAGKSACVPYIAAHALAVPGDWRMVPTNANGQLAAIAYLRGGDGAHHPFGVAVLSARPSGIARIVVFGGAQIVARFVRAEGAAARAVEGAVERELRPVPDALGDGPQTAVVYGTGMCALLIMKPVYARLDDATGTKVAGPGHFCGDKRMPVPGSRQRGPACSPVRLRRAAGRPTRNMYTGTG